MSAALQRTAGDADPFTGTRVQVKVKEQEKRRACSNKPVALADAISLAHAQ